MAQIHEFTSTTESYFILDGVKYPKVYEARIDSSFTTTRLKVIGANRDDDMLLYSTHYSNVKVDGLSFNSLNEALSAINSVVFSKGGGSGDGGTIQFHGIATQSNAPTTYSVETHPDGLIETYRAVEPLDNTSAWYTLADVANKAKFPITLDMLKANDILLTSTNGVVSVFLNVKPVADPAKLITWTATTYASGAQVIYEGKVYEANAAIVAGDVPGVSTKWVAKIDKDIQTAKVGAVDFFNNIGTPSLNLFDKTVVTSGHFGADGLTPTASANHVTSDFIPATPLTAYRKGYVSVYASGYNYYYDASKVLISATNSSTVYTPAGTAFMKIVDNTSIYPLNTFMVALNDLPSTYVPFGTIYEQKIKEQFFSAPKLFNHYEAIGDSNTWGYKPRNTPNSATQIFSYARLIGDKLSVKFVNRGINSSVLAASTVGNNAGDPMVYRVDNISNDADLITIMGGTNDFRNGLFPLGTMADTVETSYYGALKMLCQKLITRFHTARADSGQLPATIVLCTPFKMLNGSGWTYNPAIQDWVNAVKEVGKYYGLPVFDTNNLVGINPHLDRTLDGTDVNAPDWYNPLVPDGIHLTERAHQMVAEKLMGFIKTLKG